MSVESRSAPIAFLMTSELPCPYLPGRRERKIVADLAADPSLTARLELFDLLSSVGFRRSHSLVYRPACADCQACVPVRIPVGDFRAARSFRRILRRNSDLRPVLHPAKPTREQYELFARYLAARHGDGEMVGMSAQDYASMVADSPVDTRIVEWRDGNGALAAACLVDWSPDGLSAVYSFFAPERHRDSLGSYIVLSLVEIARAQEIPHVYLGYWVAGSRKMDYKRRFHPLEAYGPDGWQKLGKRIVRPSPIG